jgi:hypothetical protein
VRTKLTNGFLVLRPGDSAPACLSPSGYAWTLQNQTSRPLRLRVGTRLALGPEEWRVTSQDGYALIAWDALLPENTEHHEST